MFRDLEGRALTAGEETIIAQRVALQRSMAEEFEKRERARKVRRRPFQTSLSCRSGGNVLSQRLGTCTAPRRVPVHLGVRLTRCAGVCSCERSRACTPT